jgi:hypothetical protein
MTQLSPAPRIRSASKIVAPLCATLIVAACSSSGSGGGGATPPASDAGANDAASSDAASSSDSGPLSGGATAFFSDLGVFQKGGTVPGANGNPAIVVTVNPDHTRTVTIAGPNGTSRLVLVWKNSRSFSMKVDANGDGVVDDQTSVTTTNGVTSSLLEQDRNLGGTFNYRNTTTLKKGSFHSVVEEILPLASSFVTTASYNGSDFDYVGPLCVPAQLPGGTACAAKTKAPRPKFCALPDPPVDGIDCGFPGADACITWIADGQTWHTTDVAPRDLPPVANANLMGIITAGPMACNAGQIEMLTRVVTQAAADFHEAMPSLNNEKYAQVMTGLASAPLLYGCKLPTFGAPVARGIVAVTNYADFLLDGAVTDYATDDAKITAFDASSFGSGDDYLEELLVHEWFHVAGDHHPHDANGYFARDQIYSCSRIVDKGRAFAQGHYLSVDCCDASSARDHASCASADKKLKFGLQNIFIETPTGLLEIPAPGLTSATDQPLTNQCFNEGTGDQAPCGCVVERVAAYCDQVVLTEQDALSHFGLTAAANSLRTFSCCESCPASTPAAAVCGTADPANPPTCISTQACTPLPSTASQIAAGPTIGLRNPADAVRDGQATWPGNGMSLSLNCPPVAGFLY